MIWRRLEQAGLLLSSASPPKIKNWWSTLNRSFQLIIDSETTDPLARSYTGYVPLSTRIIQQWIQAIGLGSKSKEELLWKPLNVSESIEIGSVAKLNQVYLVYLGGVTFAELGTLRQLEASLPEMKFTVLTTQMINLSTFVRAGL
jgi:hypothetical protein